MVDRSLYVLGALSMGILRMNVLRAGTWVGSFLAWLVAVAYLSGVIVATSTPLRRVRLRRLIIHPRHGFALAFGATLALLASTLAAGGQ